MKELPARAQPAEDSVIISEQEHDKPSSAIKEEAELNETRFDLTGKGPPKGFPEESDGRSHDEDRRKKWLPVKSKT